MKKFTFVISSILVFGSLVLIAACSSGSSDTAASKSFATGPAGNNLTATLTSADGTLKKGVQEFTLTFADASGKTVDVGSVALNYRMPAMGSMSEMNNGATFTTTGTRGVYKGKVDIEMFGEWKAMITYEGPAGKGSFVLPVVAK